MNIQRNAELLLIFVIFIKTVKFGKPFVPHFTDLFLTISKMKQDLIIFKIELDIFLTEGKRYNSKY